MKKTLIDPVPGGVSVADVTERLMLEFGAVLPLADVSRAVLQSSGTWRQRRSVPSRSGWSAWRGSSCTRPRWRGVRGLLGDLDGQREDEADCDRRHVST
jgi:hypothetical protein